MRKLITSTLLLISMLIFSAQGDNHGDMTLGLGGGYTTANHSGYSKLWFRYTFSDHVRIAPETAYVFKHEGLTAFEIDVDMQFPFAVAPGVQLYPLTGVAFNNWNAPNSDTYSRFGADLGGGIDLKLTSSLRINFDVKYTLMHHTGGLYAGAGIGYNF